MKTFLYSIVLMGLFCRITFSATGGIMIFSPHPDDEALMTSGIIEAALNEGIHPRVVIVTTGDYDGGNIGCAANR